MAAMDENMTKKSSGIDRVSSCRCQAPRTLPGKTRWYLVRRQLCDQRILDRARRVNDAPQRPVRSAAAPTRRARLARVPTSALTTVHGYAVSRKSRPHGFCHAPTACDRPTRTSDCAPLSASQRAVCKPSPPVPPVIR